MCKPSARTSDLRTAPHVRNTLSPSPRLTSILMPITVPSAPVVVANASPHQSTSNQSSPSSLFLPFALPVAAPQLSVEDAIVDEQTAWPERLRGSAVPSIFATWLATNQPGIGRLSSVQVPAHCEVRIEGPSVHAVATCLIELVQHLHRNKHIPYSDQDRFEPPPGVDCSRVPSMKSFFAGVRTYTM